MDEKDKEISRLKLKLSYLEEFLDHVEKKGYRWPLWRSGFEAFCKSKKKEQEATFTASGV